MVDSTWVVWFKAGVGGPRIWDCLGRASLWGGEQSGVSPARSSCCVQTAQVCSSCLLGGVTEPGTWDASCSAGSSSGLFVCRNCVTEVAAVPVCSVGKNLTRDRAEQGSAASGERSSPPWPVPTPALPEGTKELCGLLPGTPLAHRLVRVPWCFINFCNDSSMPFFVPCVLNKVLLCNASSAELCSFYYHYLPHYSRCTF